jgi:DNA-binding SARP family transcriptional activator/tetratricopeptide (TPR) repeat protein
MAVEIALLGEVTAQVDARAVDLGPARQRCVLAALAVDAGRLVPADQLVGRVWGADTPRRGRATLHSHISRLRGAFAGALVIVYRSGGYMLVVDHVDEAVDLLRFHALWSRARGIDDDARKVALLTEALALWRGEPLTGLSGNWVEDERDRRQQERWSAEHDLVDARLRTGHGEGLVAQLSTRAVQHPLDERVAGQYMLALHRAGRTADALAHYRHLRERLVEELGTDPGSALQDLHRQVLAADPSLIPAPRGAVAEPLVLPRQLPAAPAPFVGRRDELDRLDAILSTGSLIGPSGEGSRPGSTSDEVPSGGTTLISAIGGAGGIGKTWLALAWAHRHLDRFPDGQLFVDLRGFSPDSAPMSPAVAVRGFLDALGVDPDRIPVDPQAQAGLLRSLVAHKRMLIVLDNAANAEQVAPLLPGGDSCTVVVTSRRTLTGLITRHGAHHLPLNTLSDAEARALLTRRRGAARVAAEPQAVAELIRLCGGLPLALGIIAGRTHTHPRIPLAEFAAELRDLGLGALEDDDPTTGLSTMLSWSYRALTTQQQEVFGLLGIAPGPDIGLPAAASLAGLHPAEAARVLRGLEEASLLTRNAHGRYSMHDLIRRYATDAAHHQLPDHVREAALRRTVDFYLHTSRTADQLLDPHRPSEQFDSPAPDCHPHPLPDSRAALAWFDAEHPCLLAAQHTATTHHWHQTVWQLAWALNIFHFRRGHFHDKLAVWQAGLSAVEHLHDPAVHTRAHRNLGNAYALLGLHDEAIRHLYQSLTLAEHHHDHTNHVLAHRTLGWAWEQRGDDRRALEHATHALRISRTFDNPVWEAWALSGVGWSAARIGDYDQARDHCQAALTLYRRHPDPSREANTLDSLGYIDHHTGHHHQAVHHYHQALTLYRDLSNTYQVAICLEGLGHSYAALGQHEQAQAVWREALGLYREQGRDGVAARLQQQLDELNAHNGGDQPVPSAESAK